MNDAWLEHFDYRRGRTYFAKQGYMIVENAIPRTCGAGQTGSGPGYGGGEGKSGMGPLTAFLMLDFVGKDDVFLERARLSDDLSLVWGILAGTYSCTTRT